MARNRASAKKAGSSFERLIADYLRDTLGNPNIDRMTETLTKLLTAPPTPAGLQTSKEAP